MSSGGEDDDSLKMVGQRTARRGSPYLTPPRLTSSLPQSPHPQPKFLTRRLGYDKEWRGKAAITCSVGVACLFLELTMETTIKFWTCCAHVSFGVYSKGPGWRANVPRTPPLREPRAAPLPNDPTDLEATMHAPHDLAATQPYQVPPPFAYGSSFRATTRPTLCPRFAEARC